MNITNTRETHDVFSPRILQKTEQNWHLSQNDQCKIYNDPINTGKSLVARQGCDPQYRGTCGIVSCVNILRLAGRSSTTEEEVLRYALENSSKKRSLCINHGSPPSNGGTSPQNRKDILSAFGIESELIPASIESIAKHVEEGRGVIISVYAGRLWGDFSKCNLSHAVAVTSVKRSMTGDLIGFYICDSGTFGKDNARFYKAEAIQKALSPKFMNVTTSIIR